MNKKFKFILAAALLALLLTVVVGGTLAYLVDATDEVKNTFTPSSVPPEITESFDGKVKSNVAIKNTGNIDAYIRAVVVIAWKDKDGNVLAEKPVNTGSDPDYSITYGDADDNWVLSSSDGFWYYTIPVGENGSTKALIERCEVLNPAPQDGFTLSVEILAQTIQAEPISVVQEAWGVTVNGTTISK